MLFEDMLYIRLNLVLSLNLWLSVPVYAVLSICDNLNRVSPKDSSSECVCCNMSGGAVSPAPRPPASLCLK